MVTRGKGKGKGAKSDPAIVDVVAPLALVPAVPDGPAADAVPDAPAADAALAACKKIKLITTLVRTSYLYSWATNWKTCKENFDNFLAKRVDVKPLADMVVTPEAIAQRRHNLRRNTAILVELRILDADTSDKESMASRAARHLLNLVGECDWDAERIIVFTDTLAFFLKLSTVCRAVFFGKKLPRVAGARWTGVSTVARLTSVMSLFFGSWRFVTQPPPPKRKRRAGAVAEAAEADVDEQENVPNCIKQQAAKRQKLMHAFASQPTCALDTFAAVSSTN